jgi:hypothetical protein
MIADPRRTRRLRLPALLLGVALLSTSCGLKSDVSDSLAQRGLAGGVVDDGTGVVDPQTGQVVDPNTGQPVGGTTGGTTGSGTSGTTGSTSGGTTGSGTSGSTGSTSGGTSGGTTGSTTGGGSTVGIKGDTITLTVHAPLTGASPLPQSSFQAGADQYWATRKVMGKYKVVVKIVDDKYNPNGAVQACRRAAPESFLIVGGAGTDQIQACARDSVLRRANVPYLSAGVTTNGLTDLPTYFATTMTYKAQSETVVKMTAQQGFGPAKKWGLVLSGTPNFEDAKTSMEAALKGKATSVKYYKAPKTGSDSSAIASQLAADRPDIVYFLGQPLYFADLVRRTASPVYSPYWVGPGVSMGLNSIATVTCGNPQYNGKGFYLSPFPGYDRRGQVAPGQSFADDIQMNIYGLQQLLDQAFQLVKGPLTREAFMEALGKGSLKGGVYTPAAFNGQTHFGGTKAYTLRSNCNTRQYETVSGPIS